MNLDTIIYSRVSTDEQADYGYGRDHQRDVLKTYCEINNYGIANEYIEDHSAKNFNRPEWKKLETFVKANRKIIQRVLFTKWDRFSRNMEEAMGVIRKFREWGITVNAVEQPLDLSVPNQKVMLSMYLIMPEVENDNISARTKDGLHKATKDGAFIGTPPYGYSRVRFGKYASMRPNNDALLLTEIFKRVSLGVESLEGLRRHYQTKGYKKGKQTFYNMLRNRAYLGEVKVKEYKKTDAYWTNGLHEAITDHKTFNKVQAVLQGKNRNAKPPCKKNEVLPLRGFLECGKCGSTLTGSVSRGNGGKYGYYHCKGDCKTRLSATYTHKIFNTEVLNKVKVSDNVFDLYTEIMTDVQKTKCGSKEEQIKNFNQKIQGTINLIENTEDKYASDGMKEEVFNRMINRYNTNLMSLRAELEELKEAKALSVKTIETAVKMIKNMPQLFENGDFDQKIKILGLLIPEKLIISKNECRTKKTNIAIELLTRINKASKRLENKKAIISDGLSTLAPLLRLELRTL
ncbi:recombinase family protein [Winogradskyella thalassocola]|uniref:recombinase family protein n=1 Tax=Winogradskyella thalassocola TaxID=262004 RepID=UPI000B89C13C|nr:recombinase family protein [Winogradskyella thalassocola]